MKIHTAVLALALGALIGFGYLRLTNGAPTAPIEYEPQKQWPTPTPVYLNAETISLLVNKWRQSEGLKPFTKSDFLCNIAQSRIAKVKNNWSHEGFEGSRFCTTACNLGENLAKEYISEEETLDAWLHSSSHAANLRATYTKSCIVTDGSYAVQIFGY